MKRVRKNLKKYVRGKVIEITDLIVKNTSPTSFDNYKPNLLLLRHDAIGDYILFRNYLPYIKSHPKYKNYRIVLVGNILWQDFIENLDYLYIDEYIGLDIKKFTRNPLYRYRMLQKITRRPYEEFVYPVYAREYQVEHILTSLKVKKSIAYDSPPPDYAAWQRKKIDKFYTHLIPTPKNWLLFEGMKNQFFFSQWLNQQIPLIQPKIELQNYRNDVILPLPFPYVVLFPGASTSKKRWSTQHFSIIADYILSTYPDHYLIIAGNKQDAKYSKKILSSLKSVSKIQDWTGKTNLIQLSILIKNAKLLITNDTAAVHVAASTGCPFICIAMGQDKGKFIPYPEQFKLNGICLFSIEIANSYHINDIKPEKVIAFLPRFLK